MPSERAEEVRYWLVACKTCDDRMRWEETALPFPDARRRDEWQQAHLEAYPGHQTRTWEEP